ncbi:MAG: DNA polymerase III subunit delta' [Epsilonproteobacteria bacterium]|nr:MAG: DNA polymerase III subunit delta' [Campylobacterota bacterium]
MVLNSQVIIASDMREAIVRLVELRKDERIVVITTLDEEETIKCPESCKIEACVVIYTEKKTFLVEDAKLAIEKAYMASDVETIIVLAAKEFLPLIQNKLLKVIEEPPPRVSFILVTQSKATILPTIRSRLPITMLQDNRESETFELDMAHLDLASVYAYIQKNKRLIDKASAKYIVERISSEAMKSQCFNLDEKTLQLFHNAFKAIDVGSQPQFVFTTLLLKLLARKKR